MSNRKKIKDNTLRLKKFAGKGLAKAFNQPTDRDYIPTHDEIFSFDGINSEPVNMPENEAEVIKVVPAKVDGTVVGEAYLHDDGTVAIKYDEDAPQWALDKIKATELEVGYSLEAGGPTHGST